MTTSCWGDVVFTEKKFVNIRAISWMEDFRDLGVKKRETQQNSKNFDTSLLVVL